jgi:C_GCAxxG_C_C family probable redox protein
VCQEFGTENEIIPRIASFFAGGMGNMGSVCGAVTGAMMAFGLMMDRGATPEERRRTAGVAQEFRRRFEEEMGTISCRELTGVDFNTPEGLEQYSNSDIPERVCYPAVAHAYRLTLELLQGAP